jgi:predicted kinase
MVFYIVVRGPLGVGKTTVAQTLGQAIRAKHISIDSILYECDLEEWEGGYLSEKSFLEANEFAVKRAREILDMGTPVIFDGNFYWKSQIDDLISRLDYPHYVFTLRAPLGVCIERDSQRHNPYGTESARDVYAKSTEFEYGIGLDATRPLESIIDEIVSSLSRVPALDEP